MLRRILDWVYPKRAVCMGCGDAGGMENDWLCEECRRTLAGSRIGAQSVPKLDGAAMAYRYHGPAGGMVRNLKYRGVKLLAEPMTAAMLEAYRRIEPTGAELVTFVPMHPWRRLRRGLNQSEVLAVWMAKRLGLPCRGVLNRTRNTVQQAKLTGEERQKNLKDAFRADESVNGKRVLLVDDVFTTGATALECAKALRQAGATSVYYLAFAGRKAGKP